MKIASNGVVSRPIPIPSLDHRNPKPYQSPSLLRIPSPIPRISRQPRAVIGGGDRTYEDKGHVEYYYEEEKKKGKWKAVSMKKRRELVDCLVKDLSAFSDLGFGFDDRDDDEGGDVDSKGKMMISETAELLLAQLKQLRDEEKKTKEKEKKHEKKREMKTAMTEMKSDSESSSSSSSESSSDSECDEVVDMAQLKRGLTLTPIGNVLQLASQGVVLEMPAIDTTAAEVQNTVNLGDACCNSICANPTPAVLQRDIAEQSGETTVNSKILQLNANVLNGLVDISTSGLVDISTSSSYGAVKVVDCDDTASSLVKKVEVCMGGKCKKSGAPALMDEFQRVLGIEAEVVGCKCLGKCKTAPNVRVQNSGELDEATGIPLCIGVSLDDVGSIVAEYLGGEVKDYGIGAA